MGRSLGSRGRTGCLFSFSRPLVGRWCILCLFPPPLMGPLWFPSPSICVRDWAVGRDGRTASGCTFRRVVCFRWCIQPGSPGICRRRRFSLRLFSPIILGISHLWVGFLWHLIPLCLRQSTISLVQWIFGIKVMITEADTCRKYVLPKLTEVGWDNDPHSFTEQKTFTDGRIVVIGQKVKRQKTKTSWLSPSLHPRLHDCSDRG